MRNRGDKSRRYSTRCRSPGTVGLQRPGLPGFARRSGQDLLQMSSERRIIDRAEELDAPVEVARCEVGRPDEVAGLTARPGEGEDPGVLQVAADHGADPDPIRPARDAGAEPADPPDDELDVAAGRPG